MPQLCANTVAPIRRLSVCLLRQSLPVALVSHHFKRLAWTVGRQSPLPCGSWSSARAGERRRSGLQLCCAAGPPGPPGHRRQQGRHRSEGLSGCGAVRRSPSKAAPPVRLPPARPRGPAAPGPRGARGDLPERPRPQARGLSSRLVLSCNGDAARGGWGLPYVRWCHLSTAVRVFSCFFLIVLENRRHLFLPF